VAGLERCAQKCLFFLVISLSLDAQTLSLDEILEYASGHSKMLAMKQTDVRIADTNIENAQSAYYPSLNFVYNAEYNRALDGGSLSVESVGGTTITSTTRYQNSLALQLQYDLFHFGATNKQVSISELERTTKQKEWCLSEQQLHQSLLEYYAKALKAKEEQTSKLQMLDLRREIYVMKERLYQAGESSRVDVGDEAIAIVELQTEIENAFMEYKESLIRLEQLSTLAFEENIELLPLEVQQIEKSKNFEETLEAQKIQTQIAQKQEEVSLNLRRQFPSLGLYSNYYLYGSDADIYKESLKDVGKKSWNIGLSLRLNIFEGFKHSTTHQRLLLEVKKLEQQYEQAEHDFLYETQAKKSKFEELTLMQTHTQELFHEDKNKQEMLERLRATEQIDQISYLSFIYQQAQHTMQAKIRDIDKAYEAFSYKILYRGLDQCTQP
jgi:outer membrane protein